MKRPTPISMPINVEKLNLVLCGPILRKVTSHSVAVFVALKAQRYIELTLHDGTAANSNIMYRHSELNQDFSSTVPLGKHLHVALVQLDLAGTPGLFPGQLYGYNLLLRENNDAQESPIDLAHADIALINDTDQYIGCDKNKLPCFSLPPKNFNQFNLIHGSCRKPHGEGKDMLAALDDLLCTLKNNQDPTKNQYEDPFARPHLLLLTGDQIYADDVSPPLLRALHDAANALLGWREVFAATAFPGGFAAEAEKFKIKVIEKNEELAQILTNAETTGMTAATKNQILSFLEAFTKEVQETVNAISDSSEHPVFYIEYTGIIEHLEGFKEDLIKDYHTWVNINVNNPDFMRDTLERYYRRQKALEGYLDFFLELGSDRHWGQIEVEEDPSEASTSVTEPDSETGKRIAARNKLKKRPMVLSRISPPQRSYEVKEFFRMTSDAMEAHLVFLGEFYMMYLFTWSDALWPLDEWGKKSLPFFWESVPNYSLLGPLSKHGLIRTRDDTLTFLQSIPKVRRVLANIPTLMIFDDHEVTDDWNLHEQWVVDVNEPMDVDVPDKYYKGAQLLRNALSAYAVFQDWGNRPEDYLPQTDPAKPENPGRQILKALAYELKSGETEPRPAVVDDLTSHSNEVLFDVFSLGRHAYDNDRQANTDAQIMARLSDAGKKKWHWQFDPYAGTGNSFFKLTALDTRTLRGFPDVAWTARYNHHLKEGLDLSKDAYVGRKGPAALIHPAAMSEQMAGLSDQLLNIVISPAPVFGLPLLEDGFQRYLALSGSLEEADYEAWQGNDDGFAEFRRHLEGKTVVLISGDVHYAYSNYIVFSKEPDGVEETRLAQLCSSSMKNETQLTEALGIAGRAGHCLDFLAKPSEMGAVEAGKILPAITAAIQGLGDTLKNVGKWSDWWDETAPMLPSDDLALIRYYLSFKDYYLFNFEMSFPNGFWELGSGMGAFIWNDFLSNEADGVYHRQDGDRKYRIHFLADDQRLDEGNKHRQDRLKELKKINKPVTNILAEEYEGHWDEMREVVGFNNVGRINFSAQDDDETRVDQLIHRLYWQIHRDGETEDLLSYTLHQVPLIQGPAVWAGFKRELIKLAEAEHSWWNPAGKAKLYETLNGQQDPKAQQRLQQYYRVSGLWAKYLTASDPDNLIWGAVFISYLVRMAQGGNKFSYSDRAIDLMRAAKKNKVDKTLANPFWLYDIAEQAPEEGDLLCNWRNDPFTYNDIDPDDFGPRPAQCEVIVAKEDNVLTTIGGNLSHSVGKHTVALDAQGKVPSGSKPDPDLPGEYIAVIKVRTDLGNP